MLTLVVLAVVAAVRRRREGQRAGSVMVVQHDAGRMLSEPLLTSTTLETASE